MSDTEREIQEDVLDELSENIGELSEEDVDDVVNVLNVATEYIRNRQTKPKENNSNKEKKVGLFAGLLNSFTTTLFGIITVAIAIILIIFCFTSLFPMMNDYAQKQLDNQISPVDVIFEEE